MKNKILFLLVAVSLLSCNNIPNVQEKSTGLILPNGLGLTVIEIDSCEYFYCGLRGNSDSQMITHKGNCKYCAQRAKK